MSLLCTLVVRGTRVQAWDAAEKRGFDGIEVLSDGAHDATVLRASHWDPSAAARWFAEPPPIAPYPAGSLLHYSIASEPKLSAGAESA